MYQGYGRPCFARILCSTANARRESFEYLWITTGNWLQGEGVRRSRFFVDRVLCWGHTDDSLSRELRNSREFRQRGVGDWKSRYAPYLSNDASCIFCLPFVFVVGVIFLSVIKALLTRSRKIKKQTMLFIRVNAVQHFMNQRFRIYLMFEKWAFFGHIYVAPSQNCIFASLNTE